MSTDRRMVKKMCYIYTIEYYSAMKKSGIKPMKQHGWTRDDHTK